MKLRAAIYVRVSTMEQAEEGYSISAQTEKLKSYANAKDYQVVKVFTDPGYSGAKLERPGLQNMIKSIESKEIDVVLVYKLDRLSRSQKNTLFLIEDVFLKNQVQFTSMQESFDTSTSFGRAMIGILSVFAQLERDAITERMQMGAKERAKAGMWRGGPQSRLPFGYRYIDGVLLVDDYEAMIVKYMYTEFIKGTPLTKIQSKVAAKFPVKETLIYPSIMKNILQNNIYIGKIKYAGETYEGLHEHILDTETYDKAQQLWEHRNTNKKKYFESKYLLSGILYCGHCGGKMASTGAGLLKSGERVTDYICYSKKGTPSHMVVDRNCPSKRHRVNRLDPKIVELLKTITFEEMQKDNSFTDNTTTIKSEIESLDTKISKLLDLYQDGLVPIDVLNDRISKLNDDKELLQETLISQKKQIHPEEIAKNIQTAKDFDWANSDSAAKRAMVRALINKVELTNEHMKIEWNI